MSEIITGKDSQPFIKLFKSPRQFYIYSVNQNSVKNVSENVYRYLDGDNNISLSAPELAELQALNNDKFLSSDKFKEIKHPDIDTIEDALDSRMEHLVLQVTQSCNLTCSYCPYANKTEGKIQRNHTSKCMTFETARKAVDFFLEHSSDRKKNVISFYGGEPLISFGLIRQIVESFNLMSTTFKYRFGFKIDAVGIANRYINFSDSNEEEKVVYEKAKSSEVKEFVSFLNSSPEQKILFFDAQDNSAYEMLVKESIDTLTNEARFEEDE